MKDSRRVQISSLVAEAEDKTSETPQQRVKIPVTLKGSDNQMLIENNPKIDLRVVEEYERLAAASKGAVRVTQGANYRLSHPLRSNDVPSDARYTRRYLSKVSKKS